MKYFGRAPPICSLITATTISHFQRNQLFVIQYFGDWNDTNSFHQIKGRGEGGRWQATRWVEILCRVCRRYSEEKLFVFDSVKKSFADSVKKGWREIQRREKSGANVVTRPPFIGDTRLPLLSFVGAFTSSSSFSLLSNSSKLAFKLFARCKVRL